MTELSGNAGYAYMRIDKAGQTAISLDIIELMIAKMQNLNLSET